MNALLVFLPLLGMVLFKGGEGYYKPFFFGFFIAIAIFLIRKKEIQRNEFLLPLIFLSGASFISALFSPAFLRSTGGFLETFSYLLFFLLLLLLKPEKKILIYGLICLGIIQVMFLPFQIHQRFSGSYRYATYIIEPLFVGFFLSAYIKNKIAKFSLYSIFIVCIILSGSRVGILLFFLIPFLFKKWYLPLSVLLIASILILAIPNPVGKRLKRKSDVFSFQRPKLWKQGIKTSLERPYTGWGQRNYENAAKKNTFPVKEKKRIVYRYARIAHNQFIHYFATMGIFGLFAFLFLFFIFFKGFSNYSIPLRLSVLVYFLHSFVDNPFYLPGNFLIFLMLLYLISREKVTVQLKISKVTSLSFAIPIILYLLPIAGGVFDTLSIRASKNDNLSQSALFENIAYSLYPEAFRAKEIGLIYEKIFHKTNDLSNLFFSYRMIATSVKIDPLDYKSYLAVSNLIYRNMRYFTGMNKTMEKNVIIAINLNPFDKTLLRDYIKFLHINRRFLEEVYMDQYLKEIENGKKIPLPEAGEYR